MRYIWIFGQNIVSKIRDIGQYRHDHEILVQNVGHEDREKIDNDENNEKEKAEQQRSRRITFVNFFINKEFFNNFS